MKVLNCFLMAATVLLSACSSVGPDYKAPVVAAADVRLSKNVQVMAYERQWWQRFNDDVLDELVLQTLRNNYSIASAQANVDRAMAQFVDIDNDSLPSGSIDAQVANSKGQQPGVTRERRYNHRYQGGAYVNWSIDLVGKLRRASESARARAEWAQADLEALQVSMVSSLVSRYADYRGLQNRLLVAERNVDILEEIAQVINARFIEGFSSEFDQSRILAQQSGVKASIVLLKK